MQLLVGMTILLYAVTGLAGYVAHPASAIHEIEGLLCGLMALVALSGAMISTPLLQLLQQSAPPLDAEARAAAIHAEHEACEADASIQP